MNTTTTNHFRRQQTPTITATIVELQDGDVSADIPIIELSPRTEVLAEIFDVRSAEDELYTPQAVAEQIQTSARDVELGYDCNRNGMNESRAEWISAKLWKSTTQRSIGLKISADLTIRSIEAGGLISESPFQVGDILFSINSKQCSDLGSKASAIMLRESSGYITIVVHNEQGSPDLVESMVFKRMSHHHCGIGFKMNDRNEYVVVSSIASPGKFSDSLLSIGDKILRINGISHNNLSARTTAEIIRAAKGSVSILAKTSQQTGVVVAEVPSCQNLSPALPSSAIHSPSPTDGPTDPTDNYGSSVQSSNLTILAFCIIIGISAIAMVITMAASSAADGD